MLVPAGAVDPAYTTPLAVLTYPMSAAPCGSATCQRIFPVAASRAAQKPPLVMDVVPSAEVIGEAWR